MRFVSAILVTLIFACLLLAQAPMGFITSPLHSLDWWSATASGCTPGGTGMCVGAYRPIGDTIYFTAWLANASQLPVTTGLPIVGTLNDFSTATCGGNVAIVQLSVFDWATPNSSKINQINCMTSMNGSNSPAGWYGHATSGDDGGAGAVWHSHGIFARGGKLYVVIYRSPNGSLPPSMLHDITILRSDDGGATWRNPYTVAHSGPSLANGDGPLCGAASGSTGAACADASYAGSIMWAGVLGQLGAWNSVEYAQDGATPPGGINDGCDPATYTCFVATPLEGTIARVLNTDLPSLDVTKWQYYTCPSITDTYRCPGSASSSWTSNFADRTRSGPPIGVNYWHSVSYVAAFKSYLSVGSDGGTGFAWAPAIQGPWTFVYNTNTDTSIAQEFPATPPSLQTAISSNPPHVQVTVVGDSKDCGVGCNGSGAPTFIQWDMVLGRTPVLNGGDAPIFGRISRNPNVINPVHSGIVISDSHAPGTIPRKDLAWAFDFYDHGGHAYKPDGNGYGTYGFRDIASGSAFMVPCHGPGLCDWNPGQGVDLGSYGGIVVDLGYASKFMSVMHETPQTAAIGSARTGGSGGTGGYTPLNATALQGNASYTVVALVNRHATGGAGAVWSTGDNSSTNTALSLSYDSGTGANLELGWGYHGSPNRWRINSGFTLAASTWYFLAVGVQASGTTPVAHLWAGDSGLLVDKFAGVSRTQVGTANPLPNVTAAPLNLGNDGSSNSANLFFSGLYVYGRALSQAEVGLMYTTMRAKMAARGVTLQ